jgi:hypothetical protein
MNWEAADEGRPFQETREEKHKLHHMEDPAGEHGQRRPEGGRRVSAGPSRLPRFYGRSIGKPYLSIIHLKVATSLHEGAIIRARRKLIELKYFEPDGTTSSGAVKYKIANSRENIVLDHQIAARETLKRLEAEKKEKERTKRQTARVGSADSADPMSPAEIAGLNSFWVCGNRRDRSADIAGNYVYNSVDAISMEREEHLNGDIAVAESGPKISNSDPSRKIGPSQENGYLAAAHGDDDPDAPLPIPESEQEAEEVMDRICDGYRVHPSLRRHLTQMLGIGFLTQAKLQNILGHREGAA